MAKTGRQEAPLVQVPQCVDDGRKMH